MSEGDENKKGKLEFIIINMDSKGCTANLNPSDEN